ncbi:MAG: glutathione S-transferase [Rubrivivax sp.]|jgi:glutathione S-transferase|nr:glutathione S-transferase [Rubrivivax sp.]
MIQLHGFTLSNYYNKVKMVLLEKGIPFEEHLVAMGQKDAPVLEASPLGKVPFVRTPQGTLCESQVICDWLEAAYPAPPLVPADPFAAAKVRELTTFIELYLELVARELYAQAFFGGTVSSTVQESVKKRLVRNITAFKQLAQFAPYVAGPSFTVADAAAWVSLPLVSMASQAVYGEDLLAAQGIDSRAYAQLISQRPSAQAITADRKRDQAARAAARTGG